MSHCHSCGGVIGRDCWNPQECAEITERMAIEQSQPDPVPSNANTSGLEVVAYSDAKTLAEIASDTHPGGRFIIISRHRHGPRAVALVTAASAQARIAELEALVASIRRAQRDVIRAEIEQEGYAPISDANDRAVAAEARADRLAKALERIETEYLLNHTSKWARETARAALQQETQP